MANEETTKAAEPKKKGIGVNFKVSAKGAVSVYGLGRFPVTLYREQWVRLLERTDDLRKFMDLHTEELKAKGDTSAGATPAAVEGEPIVGASGDAGATGGAGAAASERGLGAQGMATGPEATEIAVTSDDAGAPRTTGAAGMAQEGGFAATTNPLTVPSSVGNANVATGATEGGGGRASGGAETSAPARGADGKLTPGNENVTQEADPGYGDDYAGNERPNAPWRPGQSPGVDGVKEGEIAGVTEGDVDRDDDGPV